MASLLYKTSEANSELSEYYKTRGNNEDIEKLSSSCTVYIGNLSYYTTETQIFSLFSLCGKINRVILGLNKFTKKPCGFAFVEYADNGSAKRAVNFLNSSILDSREIRVDWDTGFTEGRQYGRGRNGGQKRDEYKKHNDPQRSNYFQRKYNRDYDRENRKYFRRNYKGEKNEKKSEDSLSKKSRSRSRSRSVKSNESEVQISEE